MGLEANRLSSDRLQLLRQRIADKGLQTRRFEGIQRGSTCDDAPLSYSQQRLWILSQLDPDSPAFHIPAAVRLRGRLNAPALHRSLAEIVQRHDALRTSITLEGDIPIQRIAERVDLGIGGIDLSSLPGWQREECLRRLAQCLARRPFDLSSPPLLRAALVRLQEREHVLLLVLHHIVSDGWSVGVLMRETAFLYESFAKNRSGWLAPLPIQYADFAQWQRQEQRQDRFRSQLAYWRNRLQGQSQPLEWPSDRPRPLRLGQAGAKHRFEYPASLRASLRRLGEDHDCSLFMVLMAGYQILLHRYCGRDAIDVGTSAAGRTRRETEGLIGCFLNSLVMRTDLGGDPSVSSLIGRVRESALGAFENQDVPVEMLLDELGLARSTDRSPLFQTMFVFQNTPPASLTAQGLELSLIDLDTGSAKFDLSLNMEESDRGLKGVFEFSTELFAPSTIERMALHLRRLLEGMAAAPERRISDLSLAAPQDSRSVDSSVQGASRVASAGCVHQLIGEQAEKRPQSPALRLGQETITYGQLQQRSNRLAHHLAQQGVERGRLVGICLERSPDMIVAVLAALKAGAAYLPIDPNHPKDRVDAILDEAAPATVIASAATSALVAEARARVLLDTHRSQIESMPDDAPGVCVEGDDLAYVIYTSGSTGRPKGVQIPHAALSNYAQSFVAEYGLRPGDCMLQFASLSFDASAEEIFPTLISGAELALRSDSMISTVQRFLQCCRDWGVTLLDLPTAYWHQVASSLKSGDCAFPPEIRLLIIGGETALPERLKDWRECGVPGVRLVNTYGPTESTIVATRCDLQAEGDAWIDQAPIGRPVDNVTVRLMDGRLRPVPIGLPGEICIAGAGLARGYLGQPAATALRFRPDPESAQPGARIYRSGDCARLLPSGDLEFKGRLDGQVKVRGYRIELGEIEAALGAHPQVESAAAKAWPMPEGELRIAAYAVSCGDRCESDGLKAFLKQRLPSYMIPQAVVEVRSPPLTVNGKIDRRALPEPLWSAASKKTFVAPKGRWEKELASIWREVLGVEDVSRDDEFFELGGHSLKATQVLARVQAALGVEIPLKRVFERPRLAALAECVAEAVHEQRLSVVSADSPSAAPKSRPQLIPLSFAQQRLWFLDQMMPGSSHYNIPAAILMRGRLDPAALQAALDHVVRRHESLRTSFHSNQGDPVQVIAPQAQVELKRIDASALPTQRRRPEAESICRQEAARPFDLSQGPLIRAGLIRLDDQEHVFLLNLHHIVSDDWSMGLLVKEITALLEALAQGRPSPLAPLGRQYADLACEQRERLKEGVLEDELEFWRRQLKGVQTSLELPSDRPRRALPSYRGGRVELRLSKQVGQALTRLSRDEGATLFMSLMAAFQALLSIYSGERDFCVGTPIAGRKGADAEKLIGFFVNTLVVRADLSGNPSFRELLRRVKEAALGAYDHQQAPFENLVQEIDPQRDLSRQPLFQSMLVLQNAPFDWGEAVQGLSLELFPFSAAAAKFDLTLTLAESQRGLAGGLEYSRDLFDRSTAERLCRHFSRLLEEVLEKPDLRISQLDLQDCDERQRIEDCNDTAIDFESPAFIDSLISDHARRNPERPALSFEGRTLSYGELEDLSNRLAAWLAAKGIGPESRVGICIERSLHMVPSLLGILKAGAAYVPLDPDYPAQRLEMMLSDSQASLVLTLERHLAALPETSAEIVCLDRLAEEMRSDAATKPPEPSRVHSNLAYIIYTSGSTGRPKGVMNSHEGVCNRIFWGQKRYPMTPRDRVMQKTPLSFDVSAWEVFWPLAAGSTLVLARPGGHRDPDYLAQLVRSEGVSVMHFVPSMLQSFLDQGAAAESSSSLRQVICSGEALAATLQDRFLELLPKTLLSNLYGPTEAGIEVSAHDGRRGEQRVPIGPPAANVRFQVLNQSLRPAPLGVPGELFIGGVQVARGYWGRSGLTAERFVPDPSGASAGARLYRTGDRARWLPSGEIEFLGRLDDQVKLRGFRVELGEVEAALVSHPEVLQAAAAVVSPGGSAPLLAGYVVLAKEAEPSPEQWRSFLARRLPEFMIPAQFVRLPRMPLTASGKLDRKALAQVAESGSLLRTHPHLPPRTELERGLADIWRDVLGVAQVGALDSFFELGGHSLNATQMIARSEAAFGVRIPLVEFFRRPTLEGLAKRIEGTEKSQGQDIAPVLRRVSRDSRRRPRARPA